MILWIVADGFGPVQRQLEEVLRAIQALLVDVVLAVDVVHVLLVHPHLGWTAGWRSQLSPLS